MKKITITLCLFGLVFFSALNLNSQTENEVLYPTEFRITEPLRDLVKVFPFVEKKRKKTEESPDRTHRPPQTFLFTAEDGIEYGEDPAVRQTVMGTRGAGNKVLIKNWAGQVATGFRPMDPTGAVGPNHYVQAINGTPFRVYNKNTGAALLTANIGSLWNPATANDGDPIIMYDKYADRWFVSQFGISGNRIYIAISTTSDPTGSYYAYTYTSPQFPDYLKFSIWENGYYMTSNQSTDKVFCFERSEMIAGNPSARAISSNFTTGTVSAFFVPLPADAADGGLPPAGTPLPFFCYTENSWGGGNIDGVKIWNMTVNWTTPTASITLYGVIPTSAFDGTYDPSWNDITQPGTTQKLDGIGGVPTYRAQWRPWSGYNTLVMNWGVKISATQRSIRWVELRQDQGTGTWSLYQESTYAPDAHSRWMGSIAMDDNGSIGLGYCKSSGTVYPTLCYTGRLATDPPGTMSFAEEVVIAGTSSQTGTNRYGDYSQTSLDPDGITFWHTGEYISSGVKTRIFSFQLPVAASPPVADFTANPLTTACSGEVQFTDASTGAPTSWLWNFGDGQTSTQQNPLYTYTSSGTYTVTLTVTNPSGNDQVVKTNYITINMPVAPVATGGSRCGTGTVSLSATGSGTLHWFDAPAGGSDLGTGTSFTTPPISSTTTYYVQSNIIQPSQYVGNTQSNTNGSIFTAANEHYLIFDCFTACKIVSVEVNASTAGNRIIELRNSSGGVLQSATVNIPSGVSRITLDFDVPVGTNLRLVGPGSPNLYRNNAGVAFPYSIPGLISITSSDAGAAYYYYFYDWEVKEPDCFSARVPVVATVNPAAPVSVSISSGTTTICSGSNLTFTATPQNGGTTPAYQWQVNGVNSGTNNTIFSTTSLANNDVVSCILTSDLSCVSNNPDTSNTISVTVNPVVAPSVSISASATSICSGTSVTFTATPVNGGTPSYQWKRNGANVGTNSPVWTTGSIANGNVITCVMTSNQQCVSPSTATSNAITMTVTSNVTPSVSITSTETTICEGTSVTFNATPVNGGTPSYQWLINGINAGTNNAVFTDNSLTNGDIVSCQMTSTANCANPATVTSNTITLTVNPVLVPSVTISASSTSACSGEIVDFTANPLNGGNPSYQWQVNGIDAGTNNNMFSTSILSDNDVITCIITSTEECASPLTAQSNSIVMSIYSNLVPDVTIAASSTSVCTGEDVTFTATPLNGGTPQYEWFINGVTASIGSDTFTASNLSDNDIVTCSMTSSLSCASPAVATSNQISVSVTALTTPSATVIADQTSVCQGEQVTFSASSNAVATPSYQWQVNGIPAGTNNDTFIHTPADGDIVSCIITFYDNCLTANTAASNDVSLTVSSSTVTAGFTYTGNMLDFTFTNTSTGATGYLWDFGDGNQSTDPDPVHSYLTGGMYIITMTAYNDCDTNVVLQSVNAIESLLESSNVPVTVKFYPNPARNFTTIEINGNINTEMDVEIIDAAGRQIFNKEYKTDKKELNITLNLSSYEKGLYYVKFIMGDFRQVYKLVRE